MTELHPLYGSLTAVSPVPAVTATPAERKARGLLSLTRIVARGEPSGISSWVSALWDRVTRPMPRPTSITPVPSPPPRPFRNTVPSTSRSETPLRRDGPPTKTEGTAITPAARRRTAVNAASAVTATATASAVKAPTAAVTAATAPTAVTDPYPTTVKGYP